MHRTNGIVNDTPLDAPTPCFAAVDRTELRPETETTAGEYRYRFCGCTAVHRFRPEQSA